MHPSPLRPIQYALRQSTDADDFCPVLTPPLDYPFIDPHQAKGTSGKTNPVAFGAVSNFESSGLSTQETRNRSLASVQECMSNKVGGGRMKGKVGVITGVGPVAGIGTAAARIYAREGVSHLYLIDFNGDQLPVLAKELEGKYSSLKVTHIQGDAASDQLISSTVERVMKEEGKLDFFLANAGISVPKVKVKPGKDPAMANIKHMSKGMEGTDGEEFTEVMRVNALGVFLAVKYASIAMVKINPEKGKSVPGGSLVLTASVAGKLANAGPIPYSASKAAVISMAQTAAYELTGQNIRVNAICPGLIQTDMTRVAFDYAKATGKEGRMGVLNPLLRQGLPHEVAELACWLSSEEASYVNGQAMSVDGGLTGSMPYIRARM